MLLELASLQSKLAAAIDDYKAKYPSFDEAFTSYAAQYGDGSVKVYEPTKISGTIDPVIIIVGRTAHLEYRNSKRILTGSLGSIVIEQGDVYILGRREPPDSKLVLWSKAKEEEIEQYDSRVRIIPSRIHAAVFGLDSGEVLFTDLGSGSGSILAGETAKPEPFITLYSSPIVGVRRVSIASKYSTQEAV